MKTALRTSAGGFGCVLQAALVLLLLGASLRSQGAGMRDYQLNWLSVSNKWSQTTAEALQEAAKQGDSAAEWYLSWAMRRGSNGLRADALQALEWLRRAADHGQREAQFDYAYIHDLGLAKAPPDRSVALKYYTLAAGAGHSMGMNNMGDAYLQGTGVERDYAKAMEYFQKAADLGEPLANANLGWMHYSGKGTPKDKVKAKALFLKAAEQNLPWAEHMLGQMAELEGLSGQTFIGNFELAAEWYTRAANHGYVKAMMDIAALYYTGKLGYDYEKAAGWYRKAAEAGSIPAMMQLGELYKGHRENAPEDLEESAKWYRVAAERGEPSAQFELAMLMLQDRGIPADESEAKLWLKKAADAGYAKAAIKLLRISGLSKPEDFASVSRETLEKAAQEPGGEAILPLGIAYEKGIGGPVDLEAAAMMYDWAAGSMGSREDAPEATKRLIDLYYTRKVQSIQTRSFRGAQAVEILASLLESAASLKGDAHPSYQAGEIFLRGDLVGTNVAKAVKLLTVAAREGHPDAMNRIGELWEQGASGEPDAAEALKWFRRAAYRNSFLAQVNLARCLETGVGTAADLVEACAWSRVAAEAGSGEARQKRDELAAKLTPEQAKMAEAKARELQRLTRGS